MEIEVIEKSEAEDVDMLMNQADEIIGSAIKNINYELINMYWNLGKIIVEFKAANDSKYGDGVIKKFNYKLTTKYGTGFSKSNIHYAIKFYLVFIKVHPGGLFKDNQFIFSQKVTWSHIIQLSRLKNIELIQFYLDEIDNKSLSKESLKASIKSKTYERVIANQREGDIKHPIEKNLKNPIPVLSKTKSKNKSEKELEEDIMANIFAFMQEIGNSVMLYARQYKLNIKGLMHTVDLVFFDNEINAYILVDLKVKKVTNRDVLQMQMYLEEFNKEKKKSGFNNAVGIILCETTDIRTLSRDDIYQIKYLSELPKEKELIKIINDNKIILLKTEKLALEKQINE